LPGFVQGQPHDIQQKHATKFLNQFLLLYKQLWSSQILQLKYLRVNSCKRNHG